MSTHSLTTMFYDGGCPLCRREVAHYRWLDRNRHHVRWVDIHADSRELLAIGVEPAEAMARLHAIDREGRLQVGVRAFIAIWRELPLYRILPPVIRFLGVTDLLDRLYQRFARARLRSRCGDECSL